MHSLGNKFPVSLKSVLSCSVKLIWHTIFFCFCFVFWKELFLWISDFKSSWRFFPPANFNIALSWIILSFSNLKILFSGVYTLLGQEKPFFGVTVMPKSLDQMSSICCTFLSHNQRWSLWAKNELILMSFLPSENLVTIMVVIHKLKWTF